MRMRRKRNLEPRMEACASLLIARGKPMRNLKEAAQTFRAVVDYAALFGNDHPVELEVGCGNGGFIAELARRRPDTNFIAVEVCTNVILTAMERIREEHIPNVRFLNVPAEILVCYLPAHSVGRIYLNFSTPLPEAGREKQRLTSDRFLAIYRTLLREGGAIEQKTDSGEFFDYSLRKYRENGFEVTSVTRDLHHSSDAKDNIVTEYEANFSSKGMPIYRAVAVCKKGERMQFIYSMPTKVVCGRDCVREQGALFKPLGSSALIVTGKSSAKNGALADVLAALAGNGQTATVFDGVIPNPTVACVRAGVALLKAAGADFVVAIGGGSPMDAAKAIATLAVQERTDEEIFAGGYAPEALPMAHVPTTAGTGSEVTPYSILTNDAGQTKTSITSPAMFPRVAFLDGKYMEHLPAASTVNTALDAFSHAVEGMLSRNATPMSDMLAKESLRILYPLLKKTAGALTLRERDALLYASMLAGMTIAQSGTTAVHGMGYPLTYFYDIDHGRANGLLLGETFRLCERKNVPALPEILSACGDDLNGVCAAMDALLGEREYIPAERLEAFAAGVSEKHLKKSAYEPTKEEVRAVYFASLRS